MKYTYLLINFFTVIFPVALSFDRRVQFHKSWRSIWPGMAITGIIFLFWDIVFTAKDVWRFNPKYITGITFANLPLEEILFFITVPFACLFIYACLNYYVKRELSQRFTAILSNVIIIACLVALILFHHRLYTRVSFTLTAFLLVLYQFILKVRWLNRFYAAFFVSLIPFYIINGLLTALPVVMYNNTENMGVRLYTIPVEDHFYLMALLLLNTGFFEYYKAKRRQPRYE
jgi:lycopene cyclase domain-containing protein